MQIDRAMVFLLEGQKIQRSAWKRADKNTWLTLYAGGRVLAQGEELIFGRKQEFLKDALLDGSDLAARDWVVSDGSVL